MTIKESYIRKKIVLSMKEYEEWKNKALETLFNKNVNFSVFETIQYDPRDLTYTIYCTYKQYNNLKKWGFLK